MAARVGKISLGKTVLDLWATRPTRLGATWEKFIPFGLDLDTGLGGYIWIGWSWSGQLCLYVDRY